jgi:hypothetical protein
LKVLFASSGVGLGHVTRDLHLAQTATWASATWLTTGTALQYLEAHRAPIHEASYQLGRIDHFITNLFSTGRMKLGLRHMLRAYRTYRRNAAMLEDSLDLDEFDGVVADEFWEFFFTRRVHPKTLYLTDFLNFRPPKGSLVARLPIAYANRVLQARYRRFAARIYVGLEANPPSGFEFYGQLYTHSGPAQANRREHALAVVTIGGTGAGAFIYKVVEGPLARYGLKPYRLGPWNLEPNPLPAMAAARLVVTLAGYASLLEIAHLRRRAIIIPLTGHFEQEGNARHFEGRPGYRVVPSDQLSEGQVTTLIGEVLDETPQPPTFTDGAEAIAARMKQLFTA